MEEREAGFNNVRGRRSEYPLLSRVYGGHSEMADTVLREKGFERKAFTIIIRGDIFYGTEEVVFY